MRGTVPGGSGSPFEDMIAAEILDMVLVRLMLWMTFNFCGDLTLEIYICRPCALSALIPPANTGLAKVIPRTAANLGRDMEAALSRRRC